MPCGDSSTIPCSVSVAGSALAAARPGTMLANPAAIAAAAPAPNANSMLRRFVVVGALAIWSSLKVVFAIGCFLSSLMGPSIRDSYAVGARNVPA